MARNLLVFMFGDIGDTLLAVPSLRALRNRYPDAHISVLCKPSGREVLARIDVVDDIIVIEKHAFDRVSSVFNPTHLWRLLRLIQRLRNPHFDTVVVLHHLVTRWGTAKYAFLSLATGAPTRVGLDNGRGWFLTKHAPDGGFGLKHESEYCMDIVGLLGATGPISLEPPIRAEDRARADLILSKLDLRQGAIIAVHPGTGWYGPGRRWAPERFASVLDLVTRATGGSVLMLGTGEDAEAAETVCASMKGPSANLVGATNLGELAAVLERCDVLVANDGGVAHVAASVGTPVVAVFGPSNDRAWRPLTGVVVAADLPCRPCFYTGHATGKPNGCMSRECLSVISPSDVARAVLRLMDARGSSV